MKLSYIPLLLALGLGTASCNDEKREEPIRKNTIGAAWSEPTIRAYLCEVIVDAKPIEAKKKEKPREKFTIDSIYKRVPEKHLRNSLDDEGFLNVYFTTNSDTQFRNDRIDILNYVRSLPNGTTLIIEGYADHRGSEQANLDLSNKRGQGVVDLLKRNDVKNHVTVVSYGERKAKSKAEGWEETAKDRKVKIVWGESAISRGLDLLEADHYLIDQSESMIDYLPSCGRTKWGEVQAFQFPAGKNVYTFTTDQQKCGGNLSNEVPRGRTPLYDSLYELIGKANDGESITVLTDGDDTEHNRTPRDIINLARGKVQISFVGIGAVRPGVLRQIARATAGKTYIVN